MLNIGIPTDSALKELDLLTLDANKRRRILRGAGRQVRRDTKARLKEQRGLSGTNWQGRSDGRKKRMLRRLGKGIQVHTTPNNATVTFGNKRLGQIARVHQEGITLTKTAQQAVKINGVPDYGALASRKQAKSLRDSCYKIRKKRGKSWKVPSLKWITENISVGQAGLILRILRGNKKAKSSWDVKLPARSFMGQNSNEQTELKNYMLDEAFRLR